MLSLSKILSWLKSIGKPKTSLADQQKAMADLRLLLDRVKMAASHYKHACNRLDQAKRNKEDTTVYRDNVLALKKRYDAAYTEFREQHKAFKQMV